MNSVYYKEHYDGIASNPVGSLSSGSGPWWSGLVTRPTYEESMVRMKPSSMEDIGEQLMPIISPKPMAKGNMTHFNIFSGECKSSSNGQKPVQIQAAFSMQYAPQEYGGHLELGFGPPPVICGKNPYGGQYYGVLSGFGPQSTGRVMLPLNLSSDDGPIYVNAKQYHGIIRRRRSRAKAEMAKKVSKSRKPFLHLSRHLHAKRRPRGCGGRFLNTKEMDKGKSGNPDSKTEHPTGSQRSEVLQCDLGNSTSPHETNAGRSHISGSEVTSMFSMGDLNHFPIGNLSVVSLSDMMMSGNGIHAFGMHNKWAAATTGGGNCCNLAV
ncbi:nuclear transcription factor Y subunit A-10 [Cynara cardunculus var. scolymus]|uniref:nuclear transcription factor Y subunit A-10 n=1 Tax=Cynara cardunculus var. scolymus TaxID=59895 RepID=UPI000D624A74|nr:nuclear transcription factor Y subunit A-10 [Cynara cardunculus var. scolymus]